MKCKNMKKVAIIACFTGLISISQIAVAAVNNLPTGIVNQEVSHGGGCRKDSPQGQCCHAGSKPYHCH